MAGDSTPRVPSATDYLPETREKPITIKMTVYGNQHECERSDIGWAWRHPIAALVRSGLQHLKIEHLMTIHSNPANMARWITVNAWDPGTRVLEVTVLDKPVGEYIWGGV